MTQYVPNPVQKIQDLITNQPISPTDLNGTLGLGVDGNGHNSISPLGFPEVNHSGINPATKATPTFKATYKDPKTYVGSPDFSEIGEVIPTHPYRYDGTENDNKNDHLRNTYSDKEVSDYLRKATELQNTMSEVNGTLYNWLVGTGLINLGKHTRFESIFVHTFGLNLFSLNHDPVEEIISEEASNVIFSENGASDSIISENV